MGSQRKEECCGVFQEESQPEQRPNGRETQQPREQRVRELHLRVREEGQRGEMG